MTTVTNTYLGRVGVEIDIFCNVIFFGGRNGQTISEHAAEAEADGKEWGCVLCRFLSIAVQPNHCSLVLTDAPVPTADAIKAIALILAVLGAFGLAATAAIRAVF